VAAKDDVEVEVGDELAVGYDDVFVRDAPYIVGDIYKRLDLASVFAPAPRTRVAERGEKPQPAALAGEVPVLARAEMVEQGLVMLAHDDADISNTGIDHV